MQYVWLTVTTFVLISTTWFGIKDGFERWWFMYLFLVLTAIQFFRHKVQLNKLNKIAEQEKK